MAEQIKDKEKIHQLLRQHFPELERPLTDELEALGHPWAYDEQELLMESGQNLRYMLFILDGLVKVFREDEEGREFFMYHIEPGQACALSIACSEKSEVSQVRAVTVKPTIALMIPNNYMESWLRKYVTWGRFVIDTFRYRIEDLLVTFDYVAFRGLDERLEFYLKRLAKQRKTKDIYISHQDIATDLNTSREVISRLLKKMEQRGMLEMHRQHIVMV